MGKGAAVDLVRDEDVEQVLVADIDEQRAKKLAEDLGPKLEYQKVDARNRNQLISLFSKVDSVISCISYNLNLLHTEVAIETNTHMCDLGGNFRIVKEQMNLHDKAVDAGVTIVPDCGVAPGLSNILVRAGMEAMTKPESVKIRVGGLQQEPRPPLNYSLIFSVEGLINEYVEPCMVLRDGKIAFEDPLIGFEQVTFPEPYGTLEAFNTSGGSSTLPLTYEGKVNELDYKTIRYPGHGHKMWTLMKLGLMDSNKQDFDGLQIAPRTVLEHLLKKNLPESGKDVTLIRVIVEGWHGTESRKAEYEVIDYYDDETGLTSMMRTTSFTTTIVNMMCVNGTIKERGVLPPERCVPPDPFIQEMKKRGVEIKYRIY
jgi:lysine 6-dehydrogenase